MDWNSFRNQFPAAQSAPYFLSARRGPLPNESADCVRKIIDDHSACPAEATYQWRNHERSAAETIASFFGAKLDNIALIPSVTEGIARVANGISWSKGDEILLPALEFPSNVYPWMQLERFGVSVRKVDPDEAGRVTAAMLCDAIGPKTRLVAVSHVSFLHGYRLDVEELAKGCRERSVLCVVDAAQSCGWCEIDFEAIGCDVWVGLAHKFMCALDGIACMLIRREVMDSITPSTPGKLSIKHWADFLDHRLDYWDHAWRYTGGSLATPQVYAFEASAKLFESYGMDKIETRCLELASHIRKSLARKGVECVGNEWRESEQGAVVLIPFPFDEGSRRLKKAGVHASVSEHGIRVAAHAFNTEEDIMRLVDALT